MAHGRDEFVLQSFRLLALADIDNHAQNHQAFTSTDWIETNFDGKFGAILAPAKEVEARAHTAGFRFRHVIATVAGMLRTQTLRHQNIDGLTDQLVPPVTELLFDLTVGHDDLAVGVDHHHAIWTGLDRQTEHLVSETSF